MESYFEPLDNDELRDHLRLTLPPVDSRLGWQLDDEAILAALDYLEIKLPVRIRWMTTKYGESLGTHYSRKGWHRVTIAQNIKQPEKASETLWHELVHCMQAERFAHATGRPIEVWHDEEYKLMDGDWGSTYKDNLMEKEANQRARERNKEYPLCKW